MKLVDNIAERRTFLIRRKMIAEKIIAASPEGRLAVRLVRGKTRYYWRRSPGKTNGNYLSAEKRDVAEKLAQKECAEITLNRINAELTALDKYDRALQQVGDVDAEAAYDNLNDKVKPLAAPIVESDEQFAKQWLEQEHDPNEAYEEHKRLVSDSGETMRSKSELLIASILKRKGVLFKYECPCRLGNNCVYPDFTLLDVRQRAEVYWEHFGMVDDPEYAAKALRKIARYCAEGIDPSCRLIVTMEAHDMPFDATLISKIIDDRQLGAA